MKIEIDPAMRDRIVNLYGRWGIDKADLSEALSVQQLLGDKLGGVADRGGPQQAHRRDFERPLRGIRSLRYAKTGGTCQRQSRQKAASGLRHRHQISPFTPSAHL